MQTVIDLMARLNTAVIMRFAPPATPKLWHHSPVRVARLFCPRKQSDPQPLPPPARPANPVCPAGQMPRFLLQLPGFLLGTPGLASNLRENWKGKINIYMLAPLRWWGLVSQSYTADTDEYFSSTILDFLGAKWLTISRRWNKIGFRCGKQVATCNISK